MRPIVRFPAALWLAVLPAAVLAQTAERPSVRPGDAWDFVVYYAQPSATPNRFWVVTSVGPREIVGTENGQLLRLTPDLNPLESPLLRQAGTELLRFPLRVGQQWTHAARVQFKDNGSQAKVETQVRVAAYEKVRVPAGEFDAYRLVAHGTIQGSSYGGSGQLKGETRTSYWYAPAAKAIVKLTNRNTYRGESTVELVAFRVQP
jgi:hypothetical protein